MQKSLDASLRRTFVLSIMLWEAVVIGAVLVAPEVTRQWTLAGLHLAVIGIAVLVYRERASLTVLMTIVGGAAVLNWFVADEVDGVLSFTTAWTVNLANVVVGFVMSTLR